jgi:hypothetical protein
VTDRPIIFSAPMVRALLAGTKTQTRRLATSPLRRCEVGDRVWVRECHGFNHYEYERGKAPKVRPADLGDEHLCYRATEDDTEVFQELHWRPSIHMPRWASRLTLIVEAVRVEPLQAISETDAAAEGVSILYGEPFEAPGVSARRRYELLWMDLHGPGSWDANPEVVALTFDVVSGNIDQVPA